MLRGTRKRRRWFNINTRWRVLGHAADGSSVAHKFTEEDGVRFDEIVVGSWLHIEQMNDHDYHVILGDQHYNVRAFKTKPPVVTFLFDDGEDHAA